MRACMALGCSGLAAILSISACGPAVPAASPRTTGSPAPAVAGVKVELGMDRLGGGVDARPAPVASGRNPFSFGGVGHEAGPRTTRASLAPLPPPDGLPMLPLPLAQPPLRLLGLVTFADGSKVAVIVVGSDLLMVRVGEVLANRFRVSAIGQDAVDLVDAVGDRPVRLALP